MVIKEVWGKGNLLLRLSPPLPSCFSFWVPLTAGSLGVKQAPCLSNMIPTSSPLPRARESTCLHPSSFLCAVVLYLSPGFLGLDYCSQPHSWSLAPVILHTTEE